MDWVVSVWTRREVETHRGDDQDSTEPVRVDLGSERLIVLLAVRSGE